MLIDSIKVVEAPKGGRLAISGPSFRYTAPWVPTSDSFRLEVTGEDRRMRGVSSIVVNVFVR